MEHCQSMNNENCAKGFKESGHMKHVRFVIRTCNHWEKLPLLLFCDYLSGIARAAYVMCIWLTCHREGSWGLRPDLYRSAMTSDLSLHKLDIDGLLCRKSDHLVCVTVSLLSHCTVDTLNSAHSDEVQQKYRLSLRKSHINSLFFAAFSKTSKHWPVIS